MMKLHREDSGQAIVLMAAATIGLIASVGLTLDLGLAYARYRSVRNGADAAALVGARAVAGQHWATINGDIVDYAERNGVPDTNGVAHDGVNGNVTWSYVDNGGAAATQSQASGVHVEARDSVQTHFLRAIGIQEIAVAARSTALVERLTGVGATAPFAVYELQDAGTTELLTHDAAGNVTGINQAVAGRTFLIHGPQVDHPFNANSFKGLLPTDLGPLRIGDSVPYEPGVHAGPTREEVRAVGTSFLILPIFDARDAATNHVHVVAFATFEVTEVAANQHTGTLLMGTFVGVGPAAADWSPGASTNLAVSIKLIE